MLSIYMHISANRFYQLLRSLLKESYHSAKKIRSPHKRPYIIYQIRHRSPCSSVNISDQTRKSMLLQLDIHLNHIVDLILYEIREDNVRLIART